MKDKLGREIAYLRLSLTQRCNLGCVYCKRPEAFPTPHQEISLIEIESVVKAMRSLGVNKLRLTGGEPLLRPDLEEIVSLCSNIIDDICLTTNGHGLSKRAGALKRAGLGRVNISLDSLNAQTYRNITRTGELDAVLNGIDAALEHGLAPVKLNCVTMRGLNGGEIDDFIALTLDKPLHVRFIELMPMGSMGEDMRIDTDEILRERPRLLPLPHDVGDAARAYRAEGHLGRVCFISPMTRRFCHECSRVRVTSDMKLKPCLGSDAEYDLRAAMAEGRLSEVIAKGIYEKPEGHSFGEGFSPSRAMFRVGG